MEYIKSWGLSLLTALGLAQQQPILVTPIAQPLMIGATRITIVRGDLLKQPVNVIVNASNENLQHHGGVALAISKAAGPKLQVYCNKMPVLRSGKRCPTGSAVITPAFNLKKNGIRRIIHATGPTGTMANKEQLLHDAYYNSLQVACDNGLQSIAFPAISTAIFGYDINKATPIAFKAVKKFIETHPGKLKEVRFVLWSDSDLAVYKKYEHMLRA